MINDRKIEIAIAGSRKSVHWQTQAIMWSEFCEKLKTPVQSSETLNDYLSYQRQSKMISKTLEAL